jgi:carbonic anhydrase
LLPASPYYYTYPGSKTEPDFTENVIWIVMEEPMGVSSGALAAMKELSYGGAADPRMRVNARPPVPQSGDRPVRRWRRE